MVDEIEDRRLHLVKCNKELPATNIEIRSLRSALNEFQAGVNLNTGDIVRWKSGFTNLCVPSDDQPCIEISLLEEPIYVKTSESSSGSFIESLSVVLAVRQDSKLVEYYFDGKRFESHDQA